MDSALQRIHHPTDRGYSATVVAPLGSHSLVYVSGEVGRNEAGVVVAQEFEAEARQCFANLETALRRGGASFRHVVKITIFLKDLADYPVYAKIRTEFCGEHWPAGTCVGVANLLLGARIEVDAVAVVPTGA
jgi:2-iminobutanoate/2-iminopropanoate deaminase